jgi:hypothetical protein
MQYRNDGIEIAPNACSCERCVLEFAGLRLGYGQRSEFYDCNEPCLGLAPARGDHRKISSAVGN